MQKTKIFIGISLIFISILIPVIKYQSDFKTNNSKKIGIDNYMLSTKNNKENDNIVKLNNNKYEYIAVLEIPDVGIKNGLVNKYSKYNDVKYNIQILDNSSMPDIPKSNIILASHNGTSKVSYFNNLANIKDDSLIYLYYNGIKYIYKYHHSYEVLKNMEIDIKRDRSVNTITLITCKKNDLDKQVVYIGYLINKETY